MAELTEPMPQHRICRGCSVDIYLEALPHILVVSADHTRRYAHSLTWNVINSVLAALQPHAGCCSGQQRRKPGDLVRRLALHYSGIGHTFEASMTGDPAPPAASSSRATAAGSDWGPMTSGRPCLHIPALALAMSSSVSPTDQPLRNPGLLAL